ncbi:hypothetical protein [Pelagicoccus sp. SDUM812002]|uniref:hypothetical protein n=1 Tax=Pelagicoccus sp. SDUM812002 TaxID=3041266 RepID=UPI00280DBD58|nr:hypothetical protein [Pelagicoccus sp. SDUM812002]MDQ8186243.1 hypothetical protein [Pelagicoccus sp. SDUM812002]
MKKLILAAFLICVQSAFPKPLGPPKDDGSWICGYSIDEFERAISEAYSNKAEAEAADDNLHVIGGYPEIEKWLGFKKQLYTVDEIWSYQITHYDEKKLESTEMKGFAAVSNGHVVSYLGEIYLEILKMKSI